MNCFAYRVGLGVARLQAAANSGACLRVLAMGNTPRELALQRCGDRIQRSRHLWQSSKRKGHLKAQGGGEGQVGWSRGGSGYSRTHDSRDFFHAHSCTYSLNSHFYSVAACCWTPGRWEGGEAAQVAYLFWWGRWTLDSFLSWLFTVQGKCYEGRSGSLEASGLATCRGSWPQTWRGRSPVQGGMARAPPHPHPRLPGSCVVGGGEGEDRQGRGHRGHREGVW